MLSINKHQLLSASVRLITFLVTFWIIFLLGRAVWQNWQLKDAILKLEEQLATLENQKKDLNNLLIYYQSDSFRELEARKRLGLKKVGEKMVILPLPSATPESTPANFPEEVAQEKEKITGETGRTQIANWLLWWQYFTK
ncbi:MAG TPA: septum formation initiator family protein [Patescibacteria group bacterium]|nr:septum formation initiator family protein [Patescibacteria group bacterium]